MSVSILITIANPVVSGTHVSTDWQFATDNQFNNIVHESIDDTVNLLTYSKVINITSNIFVRVRFKNDVGLTDWSSVTELEGSSYLVVEVPTIFISNEPDEIRRDPTITATPFNMVEGSDTHVSTDWVIRNKDTNVIVWESLNNTTDLTSISIPDGFLINSKNYTVELVYYGEIVMTVATKDFYLQDRVENIWVQLDINYVVPEPTNALYGSQSGYSQYSDNVIMISGEYFNSNFYTNVYTYDYINDVTTMKADLPVPLYQHFQITIPGDKILVMGGYTEDTNNGQPIYNQNCYSYDILTDTWTFLTTLPFTDTERVIGTLKDNDHIYIVNSRYANTPIDVHVYTISTNSWSLISIPGNVYYKPLDLLSDYDGNIYGAGFYGSSDRYGNILLLDEVNNVWIPLTSTLITYEPKSVYLKDNSICCFNQDHTRIYDIGSDSWRTVCPTLTDNDFSMPILRTTRNDIISLRHTASVKYNVKLK